MYANYELQYKLELWVNIQKDTLSGGTYYLPWINTDRNNIAFYAHPQIVRGMIQK